MSVGEAKIDVVYTWVDGAAPGYAELLGRYAERSHDLNPNRYRDNLDLLKYSLRSLERYAARLVRNVYVVTTRPQVPAWLDTSAQGLFVVHHDQIMEPHELPTFNSFGIVSHLHEIPGVSSRFLYVEDDRLFGAEVTLADFVAEDGRIKLYAKLLPTARGSLSHDARMSPWNNALAYGNALLDARYGVSRRTRIQHAPVLIDGASYAEFLQVFADAVQTTRRSRFRGTHNIAPEYMYPYFLLHEGRAVRVPILQAYRDAGYASLENSVLVNLAQLALLSVQRPKLYCLNDSFEAKANPRAVRVVREFLERELPRPSRFERADMRPSR